MSKAAPKKTPVPKQSGKHAAKAAPKATRKAMPILPQHVLPAPYSRLLRLGDSEDAEEEYAGIALALLAGNTQEAVARLTGMALDESYNEYEGEENPVPNDPRAWTRLHVIGVLTHLGAAAQAAMEPLLALLDNEDDWLREELPLFYAAVGQPAIEPLRRVLQNTSLDTFMRTGAGDCLEQIGEQHVELRPTIVPLLEQALIDAGQDDALAAFLVCNLLDLDAKESLPLMQAAFEEGRVDESVVGMADVEEHFGLITVGKTEDERQKTEDGRRKTEDENSGGEGAKGSRGEAIDNPQSTIANPEDPTPNTQHSTPSPPPFVKPVKLGRNEPCWCGSGKKFKQCHGG